MPGEKWDTSRVDTEGEMGVTVKPIVNTSRVLGESRIKEESHYRQRERDERNKLYEYFQCFKNKSTLSNYMIEI